MATADLAVNKSRPQKLNIRRRGRISPAQARAIKELGPRYMISGESRLDEERCFGRKATLMLEIGFGTGAALLSFAQQHPEMNCVGIEVYQPGLGAAMQELHRLEISNVRLIEGDARSGFAQVFAEQTLAHIQILFPDPWPKRRHHKRRLIQSEFVSLIVSRLLVDGSLRLATDDAHYASAMLWVCDTEPMLRNPAGRGKFASTAEDRPKTRFERRGERLGNKIFELEYRRVAGAGQE